jgi:hypothetical protein
MFNSQLFGYQFFVGSILMSVPYLLIVCLSVVYFNYRLLIYWLFIEPMFICRLFV